MNTIQMSTDRTEAAASSLAAFPLRFTSQNKIGVSEISTKYPCAKAVILRISRLASWWSLVYVCLPSGLVVIFLSRMRRKGFNCILAIHLSIDASKKPPQQKRKALFAIFERFFKMLVFALPVFPLSRYLDFARFSGWWKVLPRRPRGEHQPRCAGVDAHTGLTT